MKNYVQEIKDLLMADGIDDAHADVYALLVLTTGTSTTLENVHDAWAVLKNTINPDHKSLIPFRDLGLEVQELDRSYRDTIVRVAKLIERGK